MNFKKTGLNTTRDSATVSLFTFFTTFLNNMSHKLIFLFLFAAASLQYCTDPVAKTVNTKSYCVGMDRSITPLDTSTFNQYIKPNTTGVYVLEEGLEAITSRAWMCNQAQKTMDIQYFIFTEDNIGIISCDYMLRAACNGVKVRVIVDDLMQDTNPDYILALDQHENIDIKIYNPNLTIGSNLVKKVYNGLTDFRGMNQRMHHKTFIIDEHMAITGGRNMADEYFDFDHQYNFRDRDVLLIGGEAEEIQSEFDRYWASDLSVSISDLIAFSDPNYSPIGLYKWINEYTADSTNFWPSVRAGIPTIMNDIVNSDYFYYVDDVTFYSDDPGKNDGSAGLEGGGKSTEALIDLVNSAEKSIYIQSPYLITTELGQGLFKKAVDRGVKIYILTNSLLSTDNIEAFSGYARDREDLLSTGVHVYEYKPDAEIRKDIMTSDLQRKMNFQPIFGLHAKSMVVDEKIAVIGTFNLDPRSAHLNTECVGVIHSADISKDMLRIMKLEMQPQNAWKITKEFNPDHLAGKAKELKVMSRRLVPKSVL